MSVEVGARCPQQPEPVSIARVAGLVMRAALGVIDVDVSWEQDAESWTMHWDNAARVLVVPIEPGQHEFGASWYLSVQPAARGVDLPLLLAIVVAAAAALLTDGAVLDEQGLIGGGELDPTTLLDKILATHPTDVATALHALGAESMASEAGQA